MSRNRSLVAWSLTLASAVAFVVGASAQSLVREAVLTAVAVDSSGRAPEAALQGGGGQAGGGQAGRGGRGGQAAGPRPYAEIITAVAETQDGIFKVHKVGDAVFYEIPKAQLDKDFLWNTHIKRTTIGAGFGGQFVGSRAIRWTKRGDRILLLGMDYSIAADPSLPIPRPPASRPGCWASTSAT
jgi:hypothetical protein